MKKIKISCFIVWGLWFYLLMTILLVLISPIILPLVYIKKGYRFFFIIIRIWAKAVLLGMGFYYKLEKDEEMQKNKNYIIVTNHCSMVDSILTLAIIKNPLIFVVKRELGNIPLLGFLLKKTCVLVDRNSLKSQLEFFDIASEKLSQGLSICIFPEGGISYDGNTILQDFKNGAFHLAIKHGIPIVPITYGDNKKRFYYPLLKGCPGKLRVKIHCFIKTEDKLIHESKSLRSEVQSLIHKQLLFFNKT